MEETILLVEFGIGDQRYGLQAQQVLEILRFAAMTPIPSSPPQVRGALNLRGEMIVVSDLRILLGVPASEQPNTPILLVESGASKIGLVADEVFDVEAIDSNLLQENHQDARLPGFVSGILTRGSHFVYIVDPIALLGFLEETTST
jgi:purine-binding chemotaxis protein CheW